MREEDRRVLRQLVNARLRLAGGSPHHRVREAGGPRVELLHQLDRLVDRRARRHGVEPQELEYAKPQGVPDRGIGRARGERVDHVVERHAALDRPVGKALGEGAVTRVERRAVRLRPEGPVREGAVGVHPAEHSQRDRPGGRGGHSL